MEQRLIDAGMAQEIADKELSTDEAGVVQFVLSHTPTIEAEPVRHGRWVYTSSSCSWLTAVDRCSYCGAEDEGLNNWSYCPNCGAKVDLKED